eukprot:maker-scaffold_14-snap-gene-11.49-mRNA-1 protein AED:0.01 eAED:0.01 QI:63/1/1/1/1/1/2/37/427
MFRTILRKIALQRINHQSNVLSNSRAFRTKSSAYKFYSNNKKQSAVVFTTGALFFGIFLYSTQSVEAEEKQQNNVEIPKLKKKSSKTSNLSNMKIFCGNANPELAKEIAKELNTELGSALVEKFEDGEVNLIVHENVRGKDIYIVQPTCSPVNENLMELFLMISTLRRASARRITAVIPYYGYARQDRKMQARVPISAADVARLLEAMGVDRVVAVDLHCGQIQGFFGPRVPVDNLDGGQVAVSHFGDLCLPSTVEGEIQPPKISKPVIVSPDAGGVYRAKKFLEGLHKSSGVEAGLAMIIKQRSKPGEVARMDLVGSVDGCEAIIVDDMIDTAGTLCKAANELKKHGATAVYAFASHGLFSHPACERIERSALDEVFVTNTIPLDQDCKSVDKIKVLSVGKLIASAIQRIHDKKSVSELFNSQKIQ